jgi:transcriptional regulator with XRE-family HTH domain
LRSLHTREYKIYIGVLVDARRRRGLTQQSLATLLKKPQSFVSKYERGERRLDIPEFLAISRAIGFNPARLLQRIDALIRE